MKTFIKPVALLGLAGALIAGAQVANARDAAAYTSANNASYYINGADAYESAPATVAVPSARVIVPAQRGYETYAYAPRSFGAPVRRDDTFAAQQRHLDGTE